MTPNQSMSGSAFDRRILLRVAGVIPAAVVAEAWSCPPEASATDALRLSHPTAAGRHPAMRLTVTAGPATADWRS